MSATREEKEHIKSKHALKVSNHTDKEMIYIDGKKYKLRFIDLHQYDKKYTICELCSLEVIDDEGNQTCDFGTGNDPDRNFFRDLGYDCGTFDEVREDSSTSHFWYLDDNTLTIKRKKLKI